MRTTGWRWMLAGVAMALTAGTAQAETIKVGVEPFKYLPHFHWEDGAYRGFAADLLNAWAEESGHEIEYTGLPVKRLMRSLVSGDVDLKYPDNAYWGTDVKQGTQVHYSDPVVHFTVGANVPPDALGQSVDAIDTLGTVSGFTPFPWLDQIESGAVEVSENSSFDGLIRQGLRGRVDAVYLNVDVMQRVLDEMGKSGELAFDPELPHASDNYHVSSATRPDLIESLDRWMAAHPDEVAALKSSYGLSD